MSENAAEFSLDEFVKETGSVRGPDGKFLSKGEPTPSANAVLDDATIGGKADVIEPEKVETEEVEEAEKVAAKAAPVVDRKAEILAAKLEAQREARAAKHEAERTQAEADAARAKAVEVHQALVAQQRSLEAKIEELQGLATTSPTQLLAELGIDPRVFLDALANDAGRGTIPSPKPRQAQSVADTRVEQLQARLDRLEAEREETRLVREAEQAAADQASAVKWYTDQVADEKRFPSIMQVYDEDDIPDQVRKIVAEMEVKKIPLDDDEILRRLEDRCKAKLGRKRERKGTVPDTAKADGASPSDHATRQESSVTSRLSAQRVKATTPRSQAERWKDLDEGKFEIPDH
jgi:hypothetical protein